MEWEILRSPMISYRSILFIVTTMNDIQYKCFEIAEAKKKEKEKDKRQSTCIFSSKGSRQFNPLCRISHLSGSHAS